MCVKVKGGEFLLRRIQFDVKKAKIIMLYNFFESGEIHLSIKPILLQLDVDFS